MATIEQTLIDALARIPGVPTYVGAAFNHALKTHSDFSTKGVEIGKNDRLTSLGKREKGQDYVGKEAHQFMRALKNLEKIESKHQAKRAALQPKAPDPTNVAVAVARSDLRHMLRGMPVGKKMELVLAPDADPMLLSAVLELPDYASGIDAQTRRLVLERVVEREQPGVLAALEREAEAIQVLRAATQVVESTVMSVGEFPNQHILRDFVTAAVGDTSRLDLDVENQIAA